MVIKIHEVEDTKTVKKVPWSEIPVKTAFLNAQQELCIKMDTRSGLKYNETRNTLVSTPNTLVVRGFHYTRYNENAMVTPIDELDISYIISTNQITED